ncbi:MAG: hypothetical protein II752_01915 [Muribaculaceae bacterium]|nr:hypothetical protein [Muribaculaceae bacterium]
MTLIDKIGFACGFVVMLLAMSVVASIFTSISIDRLFFASCCGVLEATGLAWGLTYEEICVIGNIYMEAGIVLLAAWWIVTAAWKRDNKMKSGGSRALLYSAIVYFAIYLCGFVWVCCHYAMPMKPAFDLCYDELIMLSNKWHTTYNNVNYIIFILGFIVPLAANTLIAVAIKPRQTDKSYRSVEHRE